VSPAMEQLVQGKWLIIGHVPASAKCRGLIGQEMLYRVLHYATSFLNVHSTAADKTPRFVQMPPCLTACRSSGAS